MLGAIISLYLPILTIAVALSLAIDLDSGETYDWEKERVVFIPSRLDIMLETMIRNG